MLQIQLYIEGKQVELYKDESISLTQSIQDIRDISKIFTDFTRTFNVPASKNNNKYLSTFITSILEATILKQGSMKTTMLERKKMLSCFLITNHLSKVK